MAARVEVSHPEQGWSLLCNGVVLFDDAGGLLPDGTVAARPEKVPVPRRRVRAAYLPAALVVAAGARSLGGLPAA
jgi:predicted component of type VI protein secretion system